jgi:hypothetical protein
MYAYMRQMSEFELAKYRKNPKQFYVDLLSGGDEAAFDRSHHAVEQLKAMLIEAGRSGKIASPDFRRQFEEQVRAVQVEMAQGQSAIDGAVDDDLLAEKFSERHKGELDLQKSWHCLHYVLSGGKAWEVGEPPLGMVIVGGPEIPDIDGAMGYGPATFIPVALVQQIAEALRNFPIEVEAARFDPREAKSNRVYCPNHGTDELVHYFEMLKNFFADAAAKNNAIIKYVT